MSVKLFEVVTISQQHKFEVFNKKEDIFAPDVPACTSDPDACEYRMRTS